MKKSSYILWIFLFVSINAFPQKHNAFFEKEATLTYFGIDFSISRLIGDEGFKDHDKIKNYYFNEWNDLIIREKDKYKIHSALGYKANSLNYNYNFDMIREVNENSDIEKIIINRNYTLNSDEVKKHIESLPLSNETDYGAILIVESFNKLEEKGTIWFALIDLKEKETIILEKFIGNCSGFGIRNYWAGTINDVIKKIDSKYPKWKKNLYVKQP